jgi:hypothetical protein
MKINVTCLLNDVDPDDLSGSIATHGPDAGPMTWRASLGAAKGRRIEGFDMDKAKAWASEFGAWERDEIKRWTRAETLALCLQYCAGDLKELQALAPGEGLGAIDWNEAERLSEAGTISGTLFLHSETGELWAYLGS